MKQVLSLIDEHNGEIWAKLDAGTDEYYRQVDVTKVSFQRVLDNLLDAARLRPIVIHGTAPEQRESAAYCERPEEIAVRGGKIKPVQVYTVARKPAHPYVGALSDSEVDAIVAAVGNIPLPAAALYDAGIESAAK